MMRMSRIQTAEWLLLLVNLSGLSASTPRVRVWRSLKELGAATLRDGVALMPASDENRAHLERIASQVELDGGTAWLLELPAQYRETEERLRTAFDRSEVYQEIQSVLALLRSELPSLDEAGVRRRLRRVERDLEAVARIDFFPGDARTLAFENLNEIKDRANRRFSPQEPVGTTGDIERLDRRHYQARLWATRRRLWVDRVASAWLIRRFIDAEARFLWLENPADCPDEALGFDFDGAAFTHVSDLVTFEVLASSFGLETSRGLQQLGRLVHYLDIGGPPVVEAAGLEAVLAGLRETTSDDDALLDAMTPVLDALYQRFSVVATD